MASWNPIAESVAKLMEPAQQELQQTLRAILAEQKATNVLLSQIAVALVEEPTPPAPPTKQQTPRRLQAIPKSKEKPS
jgi:hypothetical protein